MVKQEAAGRMCITPVVTDPGSEKQDGRREGGREGGRDGSGSGGHCLPGQTTYKEPL